MSVGPVGRDQDRLSLHERLRALPDDADTGPWETAISEGAHITLAVTADGLRALACTLNEHCQGDIDPVYLESQVTHESEHAEAARAVGFTLVRYGLYEHRQVVDVSDGHITVATNWQMLIRHAAPAGPVAKLAYASIVAAPRMLSAGDEETLRDLGYQGVADVAERIHAYWERTGIALPVPASSRG